MNLISGLPQSLAGKIDNLIVTHTGHVWNHRKRITSKNMIDAAVRGRTPREETIPMCRLLIVLKEKGNPLEPYIAQPFLVAALREHFVEHNHRDLFRLARNNHGDLLLDMPCGPQNETIALEFLKGFDKKIGLSEKTRGPV